MTTKTTMKAMARFMALACASAYPEPMTREEYLDAYLEIGASPMPCPLCGHQRCKCGPCPGEKE
ncbi:MAG: hypothetical protein JSV86_16965 [Gemmatimonadota bacterium]|nr:MAG: hypothetical protein JSV86_16965 [Gemmatimonadota bacterium]